MAKSAFYDATEDDSRPWAATEIARAQAKDEAGVAVAAALQTATRAASPVSAISITPATVTLDISNGETSQLACTTTPASQGVSLTYVSSDPTKATVSSTGLITPLVAGSTTVTATAVHNNALTDTCVVTVQA
jgi:uncharacterized protein YjdB